MATCFRILSRHCCLPSVKKNSSLIRLFWRFGLAFPLDQLLAAGCLNPCEQLGSNDPYLLLQEVYFKASYFGFCNQQIRLTYHRCSTGSCRSILSLCAASSFPSEATCIPASHIRLSVMLRLFIQSYNHATRTWLSGAHPILPCA